MKAVIDRFEGEYAILLCGDEEIKVEAPRQLLPAGSTEGSWLKVSFELDPAETIAREKKINLLLEKLKNKNRKSNDN
jgi:hypothetical protein